MERTKEQLTALLEQSANYGKQLLEEKIALERETEQLREKHLEKQEELTQQIFELRRKLEVANNTVASLQVQVDLREFDREKVTRGHNIVADDWAGATNSHPHLRPLPTLEHIQQVAQGQYVVSDTRCPALSDCELE